MAAAERHPVDWDALKRRIHQEIVEFVGPDLWSPLPGVADEMPGWREWHWYRSKPESERDPPGLMAGDFAEAYRDDPPFSRRSYPNTAG